MITRRRRVVVADTALAAEPASIGQASLEWEADTLAVTLLFRVPPTDRALAGWDPGYWHLPDYPARR